jgi:uncharacterized protein (TIGR03067 family)
MYRLVVAVLVTVLLPHIARALPPPSAVEAGRLFQQLGANNYYERQAASKALRMLGKAALPGLRSACADKDAEIRKRARRLVEDIAAAWAAQFSDRERHRLRGRWLEVKVECGGRLLPAWPRVARTLVLEESRFHWEEEGANGPTGTYHVARGGALDFNVVTDSGEAQMCQYLYALEGETLRVCSSGGDERPVRFETLAGADMVITTLKRLQP